MGFDTTVCANPGSLDNERLGEVIAELSAHLHAGTARLLFLIAEFDRRGVYAGQGAMSCAHWLSYACGIDRVTAREKVRTARALEDLPLMSESFAKGELSYSKVRALTRIATPDNEADLVDVGIYATASYVESFSRLYRQAATSEEVAAENLRHEGRFLRVSHEHDGTCTFRCRVPPEQAALVKRALEAAVAAREAELAPGDEDDAGGEDNARASDPESYPQSASREAREPEGWLPWEVRQADAFVWMAERMLEGGAFPPALARDGHEIVVHVDAEVLATGGPGRCEVEHAGAVAAQTARRMACEGGVVAMVDGPKGEPLSVGRRSRAIPPALRRALASRDGGCRFPGCGARHRLHAHHVTHWAHGGETSLSNLTSLCSFHHRLVHEGGFTIERLDDGAFRFLKPDGTPVTPPEWSGEASVDALIERNRRLGLMIDHETALAKDDVPGPPYADVIWVLLQRQGLV